MRTNLQTLSVVVVALAAVLGTGTSVLADRVTHQDNRPYDGTILRIDANGLIIRWNMTRDERPFALTDIKQIVVDGQADLNAAEELRVDGDYKTAIGKYERAKLRAAKPWMREYIGARLVEAFARTGQFARSVKTFVELCQTKSGLVRWVSLPAVPERGNPDNAAALKAVESALSSGNIAGADRLKELRLNIKLAMGDPSEVLEEVEKQLSSPNPEHRAKMRLKHIALLIEIGKLDEAEASLNVARNGQGDSLKPLDPVYEPNLLQLEGQYKSARGDHLHAAMAYMRAAIGFPRKQELASQCLVLAAEAMEASEVVPVREVAAPLQEALQNYPETAAARKAEAMLRRLQSGS